MADLHITDIGAGPDVVLLHGIGGSADSFAPQFASLRDSMRMLAWDAPGYVRSADPVETLDMSGYADLVADVIRDRCADGAHVLGMSWGGVIATRLALRHPELVRSLVLGSSTVGSGTSPESARAMRARADELAEVGPIEFARRRTPKLLSESADDELVELASAIMAAAIRLPGYRSAVESMAATDHTADLRHIDVPTLVLAGDEDTVTGVPASQALAGGIPGAVFVTVRGAGHLANQERPDAFDAWAESFIHITERLRNH